MQHISAEQVIDLLDLEPLQGEGGYFRQTWTSTGGEHGPKPLGTAIYYLITPTSWSALHRLAFDEIFHVYLGDPCHQLTVDDAGTVERITLGRDLVAGERVQRVVPANVWQGTRLVPGGSWALLGTTMAPGFRQDAFELASDDRLSHYSPETRTLLVPFLP